MNTPIARLAWTGITVATWRIIGRCGALFLSRWQVNLLASRRARKPAIPCAFRSMSLLENVMTLSYFTHPARSGSVGVLQNLVPATIALYSLHLDVCREQTRATEG